MGLHVTFYGVFLLLAVEGDRELEETAGHFGSTEVAELGFKGDKMGDEVMLGNLKTVVVD